MTKRIRQLLEKYDLVPKSRGISLFSAATVRGLILTVSHREQRIEELYPQVLETLVYGACRELFK